VKDELWRSGQREESSLFAMGSADGAESSFRATGDRAPRWTTGAVFSSRQTVPRRACAHGRARTLALFHDFPGELVYRSAPGKLSMRLKSLLDNHFQLPRILPEHRCQLRDSMTHLSLYVRLCKDTRRDGFAQTIELVWPEQDEGREIGPPWATIGTMPGSFGPFFGRAGKVLPSVWVP
jgi:hypothetical protein